MFGRAPFRCFSLSKPRTRTLYQKVSRLPSGKGTRGCYDGDMHAFDGLSTPIGRIHLVASDDALVHLYLPNETWSERYTRKPSHPILLQAKKELREYFSGQRTTFSVPVFLEGTPFQQKAWKVLRGIPYGTTLTYAEEAREVGSPRAVRAVGSANGKNPIPIVIPCHRVIASNGGLGGYAGGLSCKRFLLALERPKKGESFSSADLVS